MRRPGGALLLLLAGVGLASCAESTHQLERSHLGPSRGLSSIAIPTSAVPIPGPGEGQGESSFFAQLRSAPAQFQGQAVTVSGTVLHAQRHMGHTELEILQLPTDEHGRPTDDLWRSEGRFLARRYAFLDPATLADRPVVTIRGTVEGALERPLEPGADAYSYPIIAIDELTVWPPELFRSSGVLADRIPTADELGTWGADGSYTEGGLLGSILIGVLEAIFRPRPNRTRPAASSSSGSSSISGSSSSSRTDNPPQFDKGRTDIPPQFQKGR